MRFLKKLRQFYRTMQVKGKPKIFCIGQNKTGTTSLKKAFQDLGYLVGNQREAEKLLPFYLSGDFRPIVEYCKSAQVFQDVPFSCPGMFEVLDKHFPGSKFILSVRDSSEQWYESLTKFHAKIFGGGQLPLKEQLQTARYVWEGWAWEAFSAMYPAPENDIYNREILMQHYEAYNRTVADYFKNRPCDLIILNLSEKGAYRRLMDFLNIRSPFEDFPWENKTQKVKSKTAA
jgi:hypothetical protein